MTVVLILEECLSGSGIVIVFYFVISHSRTKTQAKRCFRIITACDRVALFWDRQLTSPIHSSTLRPPEADLFGPEEVLEVDAISVGLAVFSRPVVDGIGAPLIHVGQPFAILQKEGSYLVNRQLLLEQFVLVTVEGVEMVSEEVVHCRFVAGVPFWK